MKCIFAAVVVVLAQLVPFLPSASAECCPTQAKCQGENTNIVFGFCFNCEACENLFGNYYCGNGDCNIFGCNCDDGCIPYDENAWCVQDDADRDSLLNVCYVTLDYFEWIQNPSNWVNNTILPTIATLDGVLSMTNLAPSSNQHVNSLVSLIRSNFTDDPLTKEEFDQLVYRFFEIQNQTEALKHINVEEEFAKMDTNYNGVIHLNEIDSDYH